MVNVKEVDCSVLLEKRASILVYAEYIDEETEASGLLNITRFDLHH